MVMELPRHNHGARGTVQPAAPEYVTAPKVYQGVGDALRRAYLPPDQGVPADWWALIDKLD
ncbi:hypothetical protein SAMN06295912_106168 [Sphingomonas laterariae]|uniref:Uncharacterized protein n=1 Tax=Edaphosphingomonas laterariae TaxID=861865 RepID=A0A239EJL4_9SPHN|nr:hypothetical protein SAMN06295912_106168 [Sphingomonas laterariae]